MTSPIISSKGLLRLVEVVVRLQERAPDEGSVAWTRRTYSPDQGSDTESGGLGVDAGVEPARGAADAGRSAGSGGDDHGESTRLQYACRYSPPGATVTVTVAAAGARVDLVVEDDGPGIPETERERPFDRFHRASDQPNGAGLGLAIADAVVRSTGGRWRIGSSPSAGARMEVSWHRVGKPGRTR